MKREIKFRGKVKDDGTWVHGDLTTGDTIHTSPSWHEDGEGEWWGYECHEETIGQFTGLKDKSGAEIYEGDIVEFTRAQCRGVYKGSRMAVSYQTHVFCGFGFDKTMALTKKRANECNIIGNIHDKPVLLKDE